jgi:hypothetical protein
MLNNQSLKPPQIPGREAEVSGEANRLQPELSRQIVPVNVNMRRLIRFMAVEVEAVRAASQHGRHLLSNLPRIRFVRPETIDLRSLKRLHPDGLAHGDALTEPRYHVAGHPFQ